jgi:hypothetical protein
MGQMSVTLASGITLTFEQLLTVSRLGKSLGEFEWHMNDCGCCASVHPKGQHDRGYIIDRDGQYEWLGPR